MIYPYLIQDGDKLRKWLIEHKVYVAKYWSNVEEWLNEDSFEVYLANDLLPLPIDQRYGKEEMKYIIQLIQSYA